MDIKNDNFAKSNISEISSEIVKSLSITLDKMETLLTLPIDYLKQNMDNNDFNNYLKLRAKTIDILNLLEVFVFDTHEVDIKCFVCGETEPKIVTKTRRGKEYDTINGEIEHWINPDKSISHIFICDECLCKNKHNKEER